MTLGKITHMKTSTSSLLRLLACWLFEHRLTLIYRRNQDISVGRSGSSSPHSYCHSPPHASGPNNEKIYNLPCGLLATFPWETTRSSCTDLQECPKAWEPQLVGNSSSSLHCINTYTENPSKTWVTRVKYHPNKVFCIICLNTITVKGVCLTGGGPGWHTVVRNVSETAAASLSIHVLS